MPLCACAVMQGPTMHEGTTQVTGLIKKVHAFFFGVDSASCRRRRGRPERFLDSRGRSQDLKWMFSLNNLI